MYNTTCLVQEVGPTDAANKDKLSLVINAHTRAISCIAVNHDGTKVATASTKVNSCISFLTVWLFFKDFS